MIKRLVFDITLTYCFESSRLDVRRNYKRDAPRFRRKKHLKMFEYSKDRKRKVIVKILSFFY